MNVIEFNTDGSVSVHPVRVSDETRMTLNTNLKLYYIGNQRSASAILAEQKENTSQESKFQALTTMVSLVYKLRDALEAGNLDDFGTLLHENWLLKQQLASGITNPRISEAYAAGRKAGALGGKLLGAGGGGFRRFDTPTAAHASWNQAMKKINAEPFDFNMETEGSKIIHVER